ncbi:hypothetical protein RGQ15_07050 [Paracoccus sp. MBLB3053]|uniref:Uncharacterized protein n=1 Tax=Paracoccus aurantius TaxID=3073814 RepID=A0ABU2HS13_9RHOB|nr:hypothetical protein [Paracoccus sp. MBLB3053]MDS9467330.1 hypothetical protein [Paracoccus sp. MBLB3053]
MSDTRRLELRVNALETILTDLLKLAVERDPELHDEIIAKFNKAIAETDSIEIRHPDPNDPVTPEALAIEALKDDFMRTD